MDNAFIPTNAPDTSAGTHIFVAGYFGWNNQNSGCHTDSEGLNWDSWGEAVCKYQAVAEQNVIWGSGSACFEAFPAGRTANTEAQIMYGSTILAAETFKIVKILAAANFSLMRFIRSQAKAAIESSIISLRLLSSRLAPVAIHLAAESLLLKLIAALAASIRSIPALRMSRTSAVTIFGTAMRPRKPVQVFTIHTHRLVVAVQM